MPTTDEDARVGPRRITPALLRALLVTSLSLACACGVKGGGEAPARVEAAAPPNVTYDEAFGARWYDGHAELAGYDLRFPRYGQLRQGRAVAITVTEPFSTARHVKVDTPGPDDVQQGALSFQLGAVAVVLAVLALLGLRRWRPEWRRELRFFWGWLLLAVFLMLPLSAWAWQHVGFVAFAQFPWRWLMVAAVPLAILAGSVATAGQGEPAPVDGSPGSPDPVDDADHSGLKDHLGGLDLATLVLALLLILSSYPYLQVQTQEPTPAQGPVSYAALMRFQQSSDEMTGAPVWVDLAQRPMWSDMAELYVQADRPPLAPDASQAEIDAAIARQAAAVTSKVDYRQMPQDETLAVWSLELGSAHEKLWVVAGKPDQKVVFNIAWFPGWRAYLLDGEDGPMVEELPVQREEGPLARIEVPVPQGTHVMLLRFEDTPVRTLGKQVAAVGWLLLLGLLLGRGLFGLWLRLGRRHHD